MFRRSPVCWTMPVTTSPFRSMYSSYIFSRSASRTASTISWLIPLLPFLDQVGPHDLLVRDVNRVAVGCELDGALAGGDDRAAPGTRRPGLDPHRLTDRPFEVRPRPQGPVGAR